MAVTEQQPKIAQDREQPELTGDTVAMGNHDDLKSVRKVPRYLGWLALFGPGAIYAATAQGSGELVFWPLLIATFGTAFIGLLLPACALQYPVTIEIGRYTTTTGETMFTGFQRVNKFFALLMWIMLFFVYLWFGGYASGAAGGIVALTGSPPGLSADGQTIFWSWGALGATVFFLVAAAFLADTWLALVDAVSRMHADFFTANLKSARNWGFRNVYYLWFGILTLVSLITIPHSRSSADHGRNPSVLRHDALHSRLDLSQLLQDPEDVSALDAALQLGSGGDLHQRRLLHCCGHLLPDDQILIESSSEV